jgi:hypothetical protein
LVSTVLVNTMQIYSNIEMYNFFNIWNKFFLKNPNIYIHVIWTIEQTLFLFKTGQGIWKLDLC